MKTHSLLLAIIIAASTSACAHISGKAVARKDPPNILIADDGSRCIVSEDRFNNTEVGMKVLCAWRGGGIPQPRSAQPTERQ